MMIKGNQDFEGVQASPISEDYRLGRVNNWTVRYAIRPQKCFLTGKRIWFDKYYYGTYTIPGPAGESPVLLDFTVGFDEFLLWQLGEKY